MNEMFVGILGVVSGSCIGWFVGYTFRPRQITEDILTSEIEKRNREIEKLRTEKLELEGLLFSRSGTSDRIAILS